MQKNESIQPAKVTEIINIEKSTFLNGQIILKNLTKVYSTTYGTIDSIDVQDGEAVVKDKVLCTINNSANKIGYSIACIEHRIAEQNYKLACEKNDRSQELLKEGLISLEQSQTDLYELNKNSLGLELAREKIKITELNLNALTIKSPVSGFICSCKVAQNERIGEGALLFEIVPSETIWQGVFIAQEFDLKNIGIGKKAILNIYSQEITAPTEIKTINPIAKPKGTFSCFEVCVEIPESVDKRKLFSGLSAQIEIIENA